MAKMIVNFDTNYDILYVGFANCPPSYGVELDGSFVKFLSIEKNEFTGVEVSGFLSKINTCHRIDEKYPLSKFLNSKRLVNFVKSSNSIKHISYFEVKDLLFNNV